MNKTKNKKYILIVILSIILIASILCFTSYYINNYNFSKTPLYSYNIEKDVDYKVNLVENDFIEESSLPKGQTYITNLVNSIDSELKYNFVTSKKINLKYTYNVIATIKGHYKTSSEDKNTQVWEKGYILTQDSTYTNLESTNVLINEKINIDLPYFLNEVSNFKAVLKLPIDAYLDVSLNVKVYNTDDINNQILLDDSNVSINIPINNQAFTIDETFDKSTSKDIFNDELQTSSNSYLLYISIILFVIDLAIFALNFNKIFKMSYVKSKYKAELDKILKTYGDVIVEIVNPVKTKLSGVVDVKDFNEMMDLEEELRVPILFYDIPGKNEGWFTLIHNQILYKYVLKDDENNKS